MMDDKQIKKIITKFLKKHNLRIDTRRKHFYTPKAWKCRDEKFCTNAKLIVVHDSDPLASIFSLDHITDLGIDHKYYNEMINWLETYGLYSEQGTAWYSGIYDI